LPANTVFFGEIGLSGAVRPVPLAGLRLKEAAKLGFDKACAALSPNDSREVPGLGIETPASAIDLVAMVAARAPRKKPDASRHAREEHMPADSD
jgi:DNA repair protein RadA/Sms